MCFGGIVGHWKLSLLISWVGVSITGGLLALVTPFNQSTMVVIVFLEQMFYGWMQIATTVFVQFGVKQMDLGLSMGIGGSSRYLGASLAEAIYTTILTNTQMKRAQATVAQAAIAAGLSPEYADQVLAALTAGDSTLANLPGIVSPQLNPCVATSKPPLNGSADTLYYYSISGRL